MSSGGISQLVAIGAQDVWITGTPEVSFFQSMYKHHTNFSQVISRQTLQGSFSPNGMSTIRFERAGDMLGFVYMAPTCVGPDGTPQAYQSNNWSNVINYSELYIGGQLIDRQDSVFTETLAPNLFAQNYTKSSHLSANHAGYGVNSFFYPFRFWFCENWQSALPLVALQYHDIELRIYWASNLSTAAAGNTDPVAPNRITNPEIYCQYIYLDTDERKYVSEKPQDMLITQVQSMKGTGNKMMPIVFNHPVKYICSTGGQSNTFSTFNYNVSALTSNVNQVIIQINGSDLADYKYACPHFTQIPSYYYVPYGSINAGAYFMLSFCLEASKFQPTGTLNFSRLDSFRIVSQTQNISASTIIYGVNYNILRIQNGMGGLMYSN
jgi:hypothetical protein